MAETTVNIDAQLDKQRNMRLQHARGEIELICHKYDVALCVAPQIIIEPVEQGLLPSTKEKLVRKVREALYKLLRKHKVYLRVNVPVELRTRDTVETRYVKGS